MPIGSVAGNSAFKSFMESQGAPGKTSFSHARAAFTENYDCGEKRSTH